MPGSDSSIVAGKQRTLIQIMQPVAGSGGIAGANIQYEPWAACPGYIWAAKAPLSAKDVLRSGQGVSQVISSITLRYLRGIEGNMLVYEVESVQGVYAVVAQHTIEGVMDVDGRHRKMTLTCVALGSNY